MGPLRSTNRSLCQGGLGALQSAGQARTWVIDGFPYSQGQYFVSIILTGKMRLPSLSLLLSRLGLFKSIIQKQVGWEREPFTFSSTTLHAFHLGLSNSNLTQLARSQFAQITQVCLARRQAAPFSGLGQYHFSRKEEKKIAC